MIGENRRKKMTPYDSIRTEEMNLKQRLKLIVGDTVQDQVQNFIDKTGLRAGSVTFTFLDVSTIEKKAVILQDVTVFKEPL
jgi:hypothetical protein